MAVSRVGEVLAAKYRLDERLGGGGMGEVYRAENTAIGRVVAIKILREECLSQPQIVARFLREARAANRVRHPNVVDVLDVGEDNKGVPFIVQEFLEGQDLAAHLDDFGGRISPRGALSIMLPVIDAVYAAHKAAVIHRDLKPENVFLARVEQQIVPKVLDFGISRIDDGLEDQRLTATNTSMGTPLYMAPEAIKGLRHTDARSDVWSLGVMLYELFTAQVPFWGESQGSLFLAIATQPPEPVDRSLVPDELAEIILRCLDKDPSRRPADAGALAKELRGYLAKTGGVDALSATAPGAAQFVDGRKPRRATKSVPTDRAEAATVAAKPQVAAQKPAQPSMPPMKPIAAGEPAPLAAHKPMAFAKAPERASDARRSRPEPPSPSGSRAMVAAVITVVFGALGLVVPLVSIARASLDPFVRQQPRALDVMAAVALVFAMLCWRWSSGEQYRHIAWDLVGAALSLVGFAISVAVGAHPSMFGPSAVTLAAKASSWAFAIAAVLLGIYGVRRAIDRIRLRVFDAADAILLALAATLFTTGARSAVDALAPAGATNTTADSTGASDESEAPAHTESTRRRPAAR
ncbi:MAG: protein kinase [Myxococcales bacterium]|nr:protein kinase [Myxococcales bacterium]